MPLPKRRPRDTFGQRLARLRKAKALSQRDLSRETGVSQRMIAYYETHEATPPGDVLPKFAAALGVDLELLLGLRRGAVPEGPDSTAEMRLWRKFRELQKLPPQKQRTVLQVLDDALAATGHQRGA